jgi:hypothetical protein
MVNEERADAQAEEMEPEEGSERQGYSFVMNCYNDGTHDVFQAALQPGTEAEYPDGIFGLESLEDALKAVIALKQGSDYESPGHAAVMEEFNG